MQFSSQAAKREMMFQMGGFTAALARLQYAMLPGAVVAVLMSVANAQPTTHVAPVGEPETFNSTREFEDEDENEGEGLPISIGLLVTLCILGGMLAVLLLCSFPRLRVLPDLRVDLAVGKLG
jgi:hypothetical protein